MYRLLLVLCSIMLVTTACKKTRSVTTIALTPLPAPPPPQQVSKKTYLALGDSYTIGQGVPLKESYPVQTKNWLAINGVPDMSEPQIIAATGWTTESLQAAIASQKPTGPFDVVSLLSGVNDQYRRMEIKGYEKQDFVSCYSRRSGLQIIRLLMFLYCRFLITA